MREFSNDRGICFQEKITNVIKFLAFLALNGTLRMQPIRRIFLCARCFFRLKVLSKKKNSLYCIFEFFGGIVLAGWFFHLTF